MIDKLISALRPYDGTETNPFMFLRIGQIVKVYASVDDCGTDKDPGRYIGTVEVQWLDRMGPQSQLVPWTYPSISNPTIDKVEASTTATASGETTQTATGSSCGIYFVPSENDLVVCGYRSPTHPIILGFLPHNLNKQMEGTETSFGPVRTLKSGEYDIRSKQQAEVYLDRAGTVQIIVKQQTSGTGSPPIDTSVLPSTELAKISLGISYDPSFSTTLKSDYGEDVICNLSLDNGAKVKIDNSGNMEVYAPGKVSYRSASSFDLQSYTSLHGGASTNLSLGSGGNMGLGGNTVLVNSVNGMTITGSTITFNDGDKGVARLEDLVSIHSTLQTFLNTVKTHTHPTVGPSSELASATVPTNAGQIAESSSTVKAGD